MKVIKAGRPQRGWSTEVECTGNGNDGGGCGATLLVEAGDLFITQSNCRDETDSFVTFLCSECGVRTDVSNPPRSAWDAAWAYPKRPKR
jgi:hypothetical protein